METARRVVPYEYHLAKNDPTECQKQVALLIRNDMFLCRQTKEAEVTRTVRKLSRVANK